MSKWYTESDGGDWWDHVKHSCPKSYYVVNTDMREVRHDCDSMREARSLAKKLNKEVV